MLYRYSRGVPRHSDIANKFSMDRQALVGQSLVEGIKRVVELQHLEQVVPRHQQIQFKDLEALLGQP